MRCQYCGYLDSRVIDSRPTEEGSSIRRRRECLRCGRRFTTYEKIETSPLMVVKKDMRREPFNADKIKKGLLHACQKRPVSMKDIDAIVEKVEKQVYSSGEDELSSRRIGEAVMEELKRLDEVAYVRFASVYRQFTDVSSFMDELNKLVLEGKAAPRKTSRPANNAPIPPPASACPGHWAHAGRRRSRRAPPAYRGSAAAQGGGPPYATAPDEESPAPAPARRHP